MNQSLSASLFLAHFWYEVDVYDIEIMCKIEKRTPHPQSISHRRVTEPLQVYAIGLTEHICPIALGNSVLVVWPNSLMYTRNFLRYTQKTNKSSFFVLHSIIKFKR